MYACDYILPVWIVPLGMMLLFSSVGYIQWFTLKETKRILSENGLNMLNIRVTTAAAAVATSLAALFMAFVG